jgi:hypothetical protein
MTRIVDLIDCLGRLIALDERLVMTRNADGWILPRPLGRLIALDERLVIKLETWTDRLPRPQVV